MTEHLTYTYHSDGEKYFGSISWLQVAAPRQLVQEVSSRRGPLLEDIQSAHSKQVVHQAFEAGGSVTLNFNLNMTGHGRFEPTYARLFRVISVIGQLDAAARAKDAGDPRIAITVEDQYSILDHFAVTFDRPDGVGDEALAEKIRVGMVPAADLIGLYKTNSAAKGGVEAHCSNEQGLVLLPRGSRYSPALFTDIEAASDPERMHLAGNPVGSYHTTESHARLVALCGIVSALDPIEQA